jgi:D-alanyl-D-alanine carboxypeptidase
MIFLLAWTFFPASFVSASGFTAAPTKVGQEVLLDSGLNSKSVVLVDAGSETVMYQKNATTVSIPASLVKVLAVDVLLARNTDLETLITIQKQDLTTSGVLVVKAGETYRAMDLVYASLIASDNTAIKALARSSGLTTAQFATEMTKRAQQMGAVNTVALEPVGLNVKNKTTAMDLVKILSYMNHSDFYRSVTSLKQYKFETKKVKNLQELQNLQIRF